MGKLQANGRGPAALLFLAGVSLLAGCVERRYTIRSDPPGATVIVNGEEIGPTPASKSFVYYGQREITLILDGYATKTVIQPINAPWWDNYFTEFFTENIVARLVARRARVQVSTDACGITPARGAARPCRGLAKRGPHLTQAAPRGHLGMARLLIL